MDYILEEAFRESESLDILEETFREFETSFTITGSDFGGGKSNFDKLLITLVVCCMISN